jgi:5-formyltetrahydrofolate cyclo-ligase
MEKLKIYTLGTSNRTQRQFVEILKFFEISQVVDVRRWPTSKFFPHFEKQNLQKFLKENSIEYFHFENLGGFREGGYKNYMKKKEFKKGLKKLIEISKSKNTVILCAEKNPFKCHRYFISEKLEKLGFEVVHILEKGKVLEKKQKILKPCCEKIFLKKQKQREKIWEILEKEKVAVFPTPCRGKIPNFKGADRAAINLTKLPEWKKAKIVFCSPDSPQAKVREMALLEKKILIVATLRLKNGYLILDPEKIKGKEKEASTIKGAFKFSKKLKELIKPDLIVIGCVAVDKNGWRLGKGGGYGDAEILEFFGKFGKIPVATTVHDLQVVEKVPHLKGDTRVDIIVTPTKIIRIK